MCFAVECAIMIIGRINEPIICHIHFIISNIVLFSSCILISIQIFSNNIIIFFCKMYEYCTLSTWLHLCHAIIQIGGKVKFSLEFSYLEHFIPLIIVIFA